MSPYNLTFKLNFNKKFSILIVLIRTQDFLPLLI